MTTSSQQSTRPFTPQSASRVVSDAWAELISVRDEARVQMHLFSMDAKQRWNELEAKLQAVANEGASDNALTRLRELTRVTRAFIEEHRHPNAGTVASIMTRNVHTCSSDDSLNQAARVMWEADCGAVPVVDSDNKVLGIITDRDVCMAAYTRGQPIWACAVGSVMSAPCYRCAPDDPIERVAELMREYRIRRVPVTDADGRLLGMVTLADLSGFVNSSAGAARRTRRLSDTT